MKIKYLVNRCEECGKFKSWDKLRELTFIPDNEFGPEEQTLICTECDSKLKNNEN